MSTDDLLSFSVYRHRGTGCGPSNLRCAAAVWHEMIGGQCNNKPKHQYGGHGWCTIHHPPFVHAKREKRNREHAEDWAMRRRLREREELEAQQRHRALEAIKQIAEGHNDPRSLAQEILAMTAEAKTDG